MKPEEKGLRRVLKAFSYSYNGFMAAYKKEASFRYDLIFCSVFAIIAAFLPVSAVAKAVLIFALVLIVLMELVNTAIETIIDRFSIVRHPMSKAAKDIGSLLVLISFINMIIVWSVIVFPLIF